MVNQGFGEDEYGQPLNSMGFVLEKHDKHLEEKKAKRAKQDKYFEEMERKNRRNRDQIGFEDDEDY